MIPNEKASDCRMAVEVKLAGTHVTVGRGGHRENENSFLPQADPCLPHQQPQHEEYWIEVQHARDSDHGIAEDSRALTIFPYTTVAQIMGCWMSSRNVDKSRDYIFSYRGTNLNSKKALSAGQLGITEGSRIEVSTSSTIANIEEHKKFMDWAFETYPPHTEPDPSEDDNGDPADRVYQVIPREAWVKFFHALDDHPLRIKIQLGLATGAEILELIQQVTNRAMDYGDIGADEFAVQCINSEAVMMYLRREHVSKIQRGCTNPHAFLEFCSAICLREPHYKNFWQAIAAVQSWHVVDRMGIQSERVNSFKDFKAVMRCLRNTRKLSPLSPSWRGG